MGTFRVGSSWGISLRLFVVTVSVLGQLSANAAGPGPADAGTVLTTQADRLPAPNNSSDESRASSTRHSAKKRSNTEDLQEIVVTGTRLTTDASEAPQSVQVYSRDRIDQSGQATVSDFLNTLPDVSLSINENGTQTLAGATTVQLHGLPIGTTLVLINGRRVNISGISQPYGVAYFDLNTIPLAAVDRVELVTQGSSAVYGSDAIAGVVNIILKRNFDGLEVNGKYGFASDHHEIETDFGWGRRWDKGSFGVIGSYLTRTEMARYDRALTNTSDYTAYGGPNSNLYMCPNQANIYSLNGSNLPGLNAAYAAVPPGYTGTPSRQEFASTAGTLNQCSLFKYDSAIQGTERGTILLEGNLDLSPSVELYSNALLSHIEQYGRDSPHILYGAPGFQSFSVGAANPYNPFGESVGVSDMLSDLGRGYLDSRTNYLNAVVGARGRLSRSWTWDVGISDSEDHTRYSQSDLSPGTLQAALNSSDPATALNPFVNASPAPIGLLSSVVDAQDVLDSLGRATLLDAVLRGSPLDLPAGPLRSVFGGEYERDTLFQNEDFFAGPKTVTNFHRKVYALFGEGRLPLIGPDVGVRSRDRLVVTVAGRYDHYDDFGGKLTPQFGIEAHPFESLLLRAGYAGAFHAPDLVELYQARVTVQSEIQDPLRGNVIEPVTATTGGNPALRPETGLSRTIGFAYASETRPQLHLSITYWSIDEENNIQKLFPQDMVNNAALFPGAVTRASSCPGAPPCPITAVDAAYVNFGSLSARGFDYQLSYGQQTNVGTFTPSVAVTQTYRYDVALTPASPAVSAVSAAQDSGDWAPRWKGTLSLDWHSGNWNAYMAGRYVSRYQDYDSTRIIGNFWFVDANLRYALGKEIAPGSAYRGKPYVRIAAVNLFNRLPQFSNYTSGFAGYDPTQADIRGRFLYAQLGIRW